MYRIPLALAVYTLIGAQSVAATPVEWRIGTPWSSEEYYAQYANSFATLLADVTSEQLQANVVHGADGDIHSGAALVEKLRSGELDVGLIDYHALRSSADDATLAGLLSLADSAATDHGFESARFVEQHIRPSIEVALLKRLNLAIRVLATVPREPRGLLTRGPLESRDDLTGEILLPNDVTAAVVAERLGFVTLRMASADIPSALQSGFANSAIVSAFEANRIGNWSENATYYDVPLTVPKLVMLGKRSSLESLNNELRYAVHWTAGVIEDESWNEMETRVLGQLTVQNDEFGMLGKLSADLSNEVARQKSMLIQEMSEQSAVAPPVAEDLAKRIFERSMCETVTLGFVTNRRLEGEVRESQPLEISRLGDTFTGEVAEDFNYGSVQVEVQSRAGTSDSRQHICRVGERAIDSAYQQVKGAKLLSSERFVEEFARGDMRRPMLIFVHGYNNSFEDAAKTAARLSRNLHHRLQIALFSWPSLGNLRNYGEDRTRAEDSRDDLSNFVRMLGDEAGRESLHLVAHSMGSSVAMLGLAMLGDMSDTAGPLIGEGLFIAPDLQLIDFIHHAANASRWTERSTLYAYGGDIPLRIAQLRTGGVRAGLSNHYVPTTNDVETIDWSPIHNICNRHSYFLCQAQVVYDMRALLDQRAELAVRDLVPMTTTGGYTYFVPSVY